jgi:hypothetical protein
MRFFLRLQPVLRSAVRAIPGLQLRCVQPQQFLAGAPVHVGCPVIGFDDSTLFIQQQDGIACRPAQEVVVGERAPASRPPRRVAYFVVPPLLHPPQVRGSQSGLPGSATTTAKETGSALSRMRLVDGLERKLRADTSHCESGIARTLQQLSGLPCRSVLCESAHSRRSSAFTA